VLAATIRGARSPNVPLIADSNFRTKQVRRSPEDCTLSYTIFIRRGRAAGPCALITNSLPDPTTSNQEQPTQPKTMIWSDTSGSNGASPPAVIGGWATCVGFARRRYDASIPPDVALRPDAACLAATRTLSAAACAPRKNGRSVGDVGGMAGTSLWQLGHLY
jgi:hypothetical protein